MATYASVVERAISGFDAIFSALKAKGINIDQNAIVPVEEYDDLINAHLFKVGDLDINDLTLINNKIADYTSPGQIELKINKLTKELYIEILPGYYDGHITLNANGNIGDDYTGSYFFKLGIETEDIYDKFASVNQNDVGDITNDITPENHDQLLNKELTINTKDKVMNENIRVELTNHAMGIAVEHELSMLRNRIRGLNP